MDDRMRRFTLFSALTLVPLAGLTMWLDSAWWLTYRHAFLYFIGVGIAAKLVGDAWYYALSTGRRHWLYLEDYLLGEVLVHLRFVFPLACAQAWVANQAVMYIPALWPALRHLWVSPLAATAIWAVNRYLVEQAEEQRYQPVGTRAADLTRGRDASGSPEGSGG
jgi:hypothetical protein